MNMTFVVYYLKERIRLKQVIFWSIYSSISYDTTETWDLDVFVFFF